MKRIICTILVLALSLAMFTGCDRKAATESSDASQEAAFAPETTAVPGGLTQAVESQDIPSTEAPVQPTATQQPVALDSTLAPVSNAIVIEAEPAEGQDGSVPAAAVMPFATATPQPNAVITGYAEISAPSLGFKFNHPADWTNIPGRSTVCYVQPLNEGTVYPARVAVTMKRMPHKAGPKTMTEQFAEYMKTLMSQYDEKTFEVDDELDTATRFMGNNAFSTGYLAYDGDQEIQGYAIMTYFDRYLFVFHFLCAYEDFPSLQSAMIYMRDSVQPIQGSLETDD